MLGAMREGYLGREMVTIDDLSRAIGEFDSAVEWVEIADAERYATENGMLR